MDGAGAALTRARGTAPSLLAGAFACAFLFSFLGAAQGAARAAVCGDPRAADGGPLYAGTDGADFGAIPEACPGTDLGLRLRATVLVASTMPDYYGALSGTSTLRLRHLLGRSSRTWLSLAADVSTYRYVVNAVAVSEGFSFGPPTLGLHRALGNAELTAATVYARVLLPLDTAMQSGVRVGFELGATARRVLGQTGRTGVQGGAALLSPVFVVAGQTHAALQPVALAELWYATSPKFALFAGLEGRTEVTPDPTFLTLAPRVAFRRTLPRGLGLAGLVQAPIAGQDRTDVVAGFYLVWAAEPAH
jgi:hypothetical protein